MKANESRIKSFTTIPIDDNENTDRRMQGSNVVQVEENENLELEKLVKIIQRNF